MTVTIRYTLLADGPSDRCLRRMIDWLLDALIGSGGVRVIPQVADLRTLRVPPSGLKARIEAAVRFNPCDVLFVHRDAESATRGIGVVEIRDAVKDTSVDLHIPVVPVRMTEAWLLIDETAIRKAADNPNGKIPLGLPALSQLESRPDPKKLLRDLLVAASEKTGRRLDPFKRDLNYRVQRVADYIDDFAPLRQLSAFRALEEDTRIALAELCRSKPGSP